MSSVFPCRITLRPFDGLTSLAYTYSSDDYDGNAPRTTGAIASRIFELCPAAKLIGHNHEQNPNTYEFQMNMR
jgi:hypothetical protein